MVAYQQLRSEKLQCQNVPSDGLLSVALYRSLHLGGVCSRRLENYLADA